MVITDRSFKYSDADFLAHLDLIDNCGTFHDLEVALESSFGLKGYVTQKIPSFGESKREFYVANAYGMPKDFIKFLQTYYSDRLGPVGTFVLERGHAVWLSDLIDEPVFKETAYDKELQKLLKHIGDGIFMPNFYGRHWGIALAIFGKPKAACSDMLLWQTEILFKRIHIRYTKLKKLLQEKVNLTNRESEVIELIALGKTNNEIAMILEIKPNTVASYVKNLYLKLDATDRVTATLRARSYDLLG